MVLTIGWIKNSHKNYLCCFGNYVEISFHCLGGRNLLFGGLKFGFFRNKSVVLLKVPTYFL